MPKLLFVRPPLDAVEERKIRKLAGARHAPADWIRRARMIVLSGDGVRVPAIAQALGCSQKAVRERLARFAAADRPRRAGGVDPGRAHRRGPRGRYRHRPLPGAPDPAGRGRALAAAPLVDHQRRSGVRPKRARVVEYYTHPPEQTTVIAADELAPGEAAHLRPAGGL